MVEDEINKLRKKLEDQIEKNEKYELVCETSKKIDKLIIEYYKNYGLMGVKQTL